MAKIDCLVVDSGGCGGDERGNGDAAKGESIQAIGKGRLAINWILVHYQDAAFVLIHGDRWPETAAATDQVSCPGEGDGDGGDDR